jgi:hypothetical protein
MKKRQSSRSIKTKKIRKHSDEEEAGISLWIEARARIDQPAPLVKQWSSEERKAILDYLHGDTPAEEVEAACYYEYARESEILRKARREYDPSNAENSSLWISHYFPGWISGQPAMAVWQCPDYPALPWCELDQAQRQNISLNFGRPGPKPIIKDVRLLNAMGVFDRFKQLAKDARGCKKPMVWGAHCPPIIGDNEIKHVVVALNYRGGKDAMKQMFCRWVDNDANQELFKKYYKKPIHKQNPDSAVRYKEFLKFLAAWRLYDELGFEKAAEWTKKNRREDTEAEDAIRLKPFFREKLLFRKKLSKRLNVSALYEEPRQWEDAIGKAETFLKREIECGGMG